MKTAVFRVPIFGILAAFAFMSSPVAGQGWTNRYDGFAKGDDVATAIAVAPDGTVVVTGHSNTNYLYSPDYLTIAYSGFGLPLWTNRYDGLAQSGDYAVGLALNANADVLVTGRSYNGRTYDIVTLAYSSTGAPLWTNRYEPGNRSLWPVAIAVAHTGNVFVTGTIYGEGQYDFLTIGYSSTGALSWTNIYNGLGSSNDFPVALAVNTNGNVFVTGYTWNGSNNDSVTIAYSGNGLPLWTNSHAGSANRDDRGADIAVNSRGQVIVTGSEAGQLLGTCATLAYSATGVSLWTNYHNGSPTALAVDLFGNVFVTAEVIHAVGSRSTFDYSTVGYSAAGVPLWTNYYNGPPNDRDYATDVAVDRTGSVHVTGSSFGSFDIDGSRYDYATVSYSSAGMPLSTNRYDGGVSDRDDASAIAVDAHGNVFVTGSSGSGRPMSTRDYLTIKYSNPAVPLLRSAYTSDGRMQVSWPSSFASFVLEQNTDVAMTNGWSEGGSIVHDDGATKSVTITPSAEKLFLRLRN